MKGGVWEKRKLERQEKEKEQDHFPDARISEPCV